MPKVLFIAPQPFFEWRGSPIRVGFNALALSELGYDVDLLTLPFGIEKNIKGTNIIRVSNPFGFQKISIGPSFPKVFFDLLLLLKGAGLVLKNKYDIIHGVEEAGAIAAILAKAGRCKAIFEKHSDPFSYSAGILKNIILHLYSKVEALTVKHVDAVIGTGPGLVHQVNAIGVDTPAFHIFDIPSSLNEPSREAAKTIASKIKQSKEELLITFVGSFAVYQGIDLMFEAIPKVVKLNPHAHFVIIGGTDEEINQKKQILEKGDLNRSVSFLGKISPDLLPNYLAASDILLAPRMAGVNTPLKLLDYLKVGRAIVATNVEANRLILDEKTALLTPLHSSAYAKGICQLIENDHLRYTLGINGKKRYREKYNFRVFKTRLSDTYQKVMTSKHVRY